MTKTEPSKGKALKGADQKSERLRVREGFGHLVGRHANRYPEIPPETDSEKYLASLDSLVSVS